MTPTNAAGAVSAAGATNVGFWSFSARSGKLTAAWGRRQFCCAVAATIFPRVIWASPTGDTTIATGAAQDRQGADPVIRTADGRLRPLPVEGLISYPTQLDFVELTVAW